MPDGTKRIYLTTNPGLICLVNQGDKYDPAACPSTDAPQTIWTGIRNEQGRGIFDAKKISNAFPWSLAAALTPGGRHVRLYLETEGRIKTMISEKDNFVRFQNEGSVTFQTPTAQRLSPFPVRDPNITANDLGVYVMTWDNRDPKIGPDSPEDATAVSPTFGLAFSVDGLNWTVYSNELVIDGLQRTISTSGTHCSKVATGEVRHVVPVFVTSEQLRLYFSNKIVNIGGGSCIAPASCSLGTAISN